MCCCVAYYAPFTTTVMKNDDDQDGNNESGKWELSKKSKIRKIAKVAVETIYVFFGETKGLNVNQEGKVTTERLNG